MVCSLLPLCFFGSVALPVKGKGEAGWAFPTHPCQKPHGQTQEPIKILRFGPSSTQNPGYSLPKRRQDRTCLLVCQPARPRAWVNTDTTQMSPVLVSHLRHCDCQRVLPPLLLLLKLLKLLFSSFFYQYARADGEKWVSLNVGPSIHSWK